MLPLSVGVYGIEKQRRVDHHTVEADRPVQVCSGHAAGGPDSADHIAGVDGIAWPYVDGAEVALHGQQAAAMVEPDRLAIEKVIATVDHPACRRGDDGRAHTCGDVHAAVRVARLAVEDAPHAE